jgi:hypothetical protein
MQADFDAAGVPLIIIGPGTEKQATTFKEETQFPGGKKLLNRRLFQLQLLAFGSS